MANTTNIKEPSRARVLYVALLYGGFLACTSVLLWGGYLVSLPSTFDVEYRVASYFACGFSFPVGFFASAAASYIAPTKTAWRSPLAAFALSTTAAFLLLAQIKTGICDPTIGVATGGIIGFASALFFCGLQEIVASLKIFSSGVAVFGAAAISAVLYLLFKVLPDNITVWLVMFVCMPMVAAGQVIAQRLAKQNGKPHPMFQTIPKNNQGKIVNAARDLWRSLLCISSSALLIGIIRADALDTATALSDTNDSGMLGLLFASVALLALWKTIYEQGLLSKLQLIVFPLIATSFLLLPFLSKTSQDIFVSLAFTVFSITSSLMVVSCTRAARVYAIHPVLTYGTFAGVVYSFLVMGALASFAFGGMRQDGSFWLFAVALVAIYVLSMALMLGKKPARLGIRSKAAEERTGMGKNTEAEEDNVDAKAAGKKRGLNHPSAKRCAEAAGRFGLTARESEIMELLAYGRDVPFIAEELTLSKNTVRTHVKNIFFKMNVHSKQELIDLVSFFEL
ncbi:helix-turn-helix transcriptional regulator [Slackia piriformis]|uniref:helix-turn-helix transcriptional regulator n=1 Tax=Slackia piriformis TaxID=626934 RepID=UPI0026DDA258|nr:LuxR C-terminal-related transcriptional regulator [Slackia piriformis]MDO5024323.1 LuxR C-terminal-related transcriptional regulator [Slackia piriformis]